MTKEFGDGSLCRGLRLAMLVWAIRLFGALSALTFQDQISELLG